MGVDKERLQGKIVNQEDSQKDIEGLINGLIQSLIQEQGKKTS